MNLKHYYSLLKKQESCSEISDQITARTLRKTTDIKNSIETIHCIAYGGWKYGSLKKMF